MAKRFQSAEKDSYWRWHVDMQAAGGLSVRAYCGHGKRLVGGLICPAIVVEQSRVQVPEPAVPQSNSPVNSTIRMMSATELKSVLVPLIDHSPSPSGASTCWF